MYHSDPLKNERIQQEISRRVEEALQREKEQELHRKDKLREIFQQEQIELLRLSEERQATSSELQMKEMEKRLFDLESKKERQRQEEAKRKMEMQKLLNCEEARQILSKQKHDMVKKDQIWQMHQKVALSKKKSEEESYYREIVRKDLQESMRLEEESSKLRCRRQLEAKAAYLEQMELKRQQNEQESKEREKERLELKIEIDKMKEAEHEELKTKAKRTADLAKELKFCMEQEYERRKMRREEEKQLQHDILVFNDNQQGVKKSQMKMEMKLFQESLEGMKKKREIEERQFDEKLEEMKKELEKRSEIERKRLEIASRELLQNVYSGRQEQLRESAEQEKIKQSENAAERVRLKREIEQYNSDIIRRKECEIQRKRAYADELKRQMQEREAAKALEDERLLREKEAALAEEVQRKLELDELINHPPGSDRHPLIGINMAIFYMPPQSP